MAEDPDAYLGLEGCPDSPNQSYTEIDDDGHLAIEMSPDNPTDSGGLGINSDSRSYFDDVFQICNNGKQAVCVWIGDAEWPIYDRDDAEDEKRVEFYTGGSAGASDLTELAGQSIVGEGNAVLLGVGECICVGLAVVSKGLSAEDQVLEDLDDEIVIHADADAECNAEVACADLTAEYSCTVRDPPEEGGEPIGTRHTVTNNGTDAADYGWAIIDEPNAYRDARTNPRTVTALGGDTFTADASSPQDGIVWWEDDENCAAETLTTYAEFRDERGMDNDDLIDYIENETDGIPNDAFVVEIGGYPVTEDNRVFCDEQNTAV